MRCMDLELIVQSEVKSERERQISYINVYVHNLERWYWQSYVQGNKEYTDVKNKILDSVGEEKGGKFEWIALKHEYYHM